MSKTTIRNTKTTVKQKSANTHYVRNEVTGKSTLSPKKEQLRQANEALTRAWDLVSRRKNQGDV